MFLYGPLYALYMIDHLLFNVQQAVFQLYPRQEQVNQFLKAINEGGIG
jgi:hypothetical protein